MPRPPYDDLLTHESEQRLARLVKRLPHPVALAGGHAVRLRVHDEWNRLNGSGYFGSCDIDLVYLVEPEWGLDEIRRNAVGELSARIRAAGYRPSGLFRFTLYLDASGAELAEEPKPPLKPGQDYLELHLDPMVTHAHPRIRDALGFPPIDEPLLAPVFRDPALRTVLDAMGSNVYLPTAPVLVATKLNSLPDRTKDDKAVKDVCDLYALVMHGGASEREIRRYVHAALPDAPGLVHAAIKSPFLSEAAAFLDVDAASIVASLAPLERP